MLPRMPFYSLLRGGGDTCGEVVRAVLRGEQEGAMAGVEGEAKELEMRGKISYLWG